MLTHNWPYHINKVQKPPFLTWKMMWDNVRVDGRDMGEMTGGIKGGMKTTTFLCIKVFREFDGRDRNFFEKFFCFVT